MLLDLRRELPASTDLQSLPGFSVASETGLLTDVLLARPEHLEIVPCNAVSRRSLADGLSASPLLAVRQHHALAQALTRAGVRCHFVAPREGCADLCFTRDTVLMGPWGLIELRPAAAHRSAEPTHLLRAAQSLGVPRHGRIERGHVEGGDVCLLREGVVLIGFSGERTNRMGAEALASLFHARGWRSILTPFDPRFLHLDTLFTLVAPDCAVACAEALEPACLAAISAHGIEIIPVTLDEVERLGANLLALGAGRVLSPGGNQRVNELLRRRGLEVICVELDQFTRCGGGVHCLTMPLARIG